MDDNKTETNFADATEPLVSEIVSTSDALIRHYGSFIEKRNRWDDEKEKAKKKKGKKEGGLKRKKDLDLEQYDDHFSNFNVLAPNKYDPFMREQSPLREGNVIPEILELSLYEHSGFFFGMKHERNVFIGKPAHEEGHILIAGVPGSGKTQAVVIPTMMTWRGIQIIIDVKGNLYNYCPNC